MPRTIHMAAFIPAPPEKLFDMYLDPKFHAAITGAPVSIGHRPGAPFLSVQKVSTNVESMSLSFQPSALQDCTIKRFGTT